LLRTNEKKVQVGMKRLLLVLAFALSVILSGEVACSQTKAVGWWVFGKAHGLAAANGRLFVSTDNGAIYCFRQKM